MNSLKVERTCLYLYMCFVEMGRSYNLFFWRYYNDVKNNECLRIMVDAYSSVASFLLWTVDSHVLLPAKYLGVHQLGAQILS